MKSAVGKNVLLITVMLASTGVIMFFCLLMTSSVFSVGLLNKGLFVSQFGFLVSPSKSKTSL